MSFTRKMKRQNRTQTWKEYTDSAVKENDRWYYLNEEVKERAASFEKGLYIYTDEDRWARDDNKMGETVRGRVRIFEQGDASQSQPFYLVDIIPVSDLNKGEHLDAKVHD